MFLKYVLDSSSHFFWSRRKVDHRAGSKEKEGSDAERISCLVLGVSSFSGYKPSCVLEKRPHVILVPNSQTTSTLQVLQ
jgi:hypothetical protein